MPSLDWQTGVKEGRAPLATQECVRQIDLNTEEVALQRASTIGMKSITAVQVKDEFSARPRRALVITTVVHESRAVEAHLSGTEFVKGTNGKIYQLGTFAEPTGDWAIVHAICQPGNTDAAITVAAAHVDFGAFDAQLFIGVAGSLKEDVPIGSVIVGDYVYNSESGKEDDRGNYSRPHSRDASAELLETAKVLVFTGDWVDLIKSPTKTTLPSPDDYPCPYPPVADIKAIASGEKVVAGGKTPAYRKIRKYLNDAAAVEMEGFGAMSAAHQQRTPAVVVRGISDMCAGKDHVSDKVHQPIASAHAAAMGFSILGMMSRLAPGGPEGEDVEVPGNAPPLPDAQLEARVEFVLNCKGNLEEWHQERIDLMVAGVRTATGDPDVQLLRVEKGSVRLVLSVRKRDLPALSPEAIAPSAQTRDILLGAVTLAELIDAEAAKAALMKASAGLLSWEKELPGGGWIDRPELEDIESRLDDPFSATVLLGPPGSGKSALLATIAAALVAKGQPVLGIKADLLSTEVRTEEDLARHLGLPKLPSLLIEELARLQPVYLLLDQLDALASQLDLHSDRLNVLLNLVRQLGRLHNVHIILSARTFEFNHDVRLRAVEAEQVTLQLPAWQQVADRLSSSGIDTETWPDGAKEVVRNPQALKTFLSLPTPRDQQPFAKYQAMLERLWRDKIQGAANSDALSVLATEMAAIMAEEESLWLAASRFDTRASTLADLEATGLIVRSENGLAVAFSHQTVFEYVLARSFVAGAGRLSTYVLERQNSLFVRAKLWSALRYLRDTEVQSYEREIREIWSAKGLRRHLRLLLIEFLGEQNDPTPWEVLAFQDVMGWAEFRLNGLKAIAGNAAWFANFLKTAIPSAMKGPDAEINQAVRILTSAWKFAPDDVARLLNEVWLPDAARDFATWNVLDGNRSWDEKALQIGRVILARTAVSTWHVDFTASTLAVEQPEIAFEVVKAKLGNLLDRAREAPPSAPYPENGTEDEKVVWALKDAPGKPFESLLESTEWHSLPDMAEAEPKLFMQVLWPWYKEALTELQRRLRASDVDHLFSGQFALRLDIGDDAGERLGRDEPLLSSLVAAVEGLARQEPAYFAQWAAAEDEFALMAVQRLIAHGMISAPREFAGRALEWMFADERRLQLGNIDASRQTVAALVRGAAAFWTDAELADFEERVMAYRPATPSHLTTPEQRRHFTTFIRSTKAHLLSQIPADRQSKAAAELVRTESRALGELDRGIRHYGGSLIGSPMEAEAMGKAKDREILKIFAEVPDNTDWDHPHNWMRGGNVQLSRAFAEFAKAEPIRAMRIMEQFQPQMQERAAGYALEAIAESAGHDEAIQAALLDLYDRGFGASEFRSSAAYAIGKIAQRGTAIDEEVIEVLVAWLAASPEPEDDEEAEPVDAGEEQEAAEKKEVRRQSVLWGMWGGTVLPGGNYPILSALTSILLKDEPGRDRLMGIFQDHLARERDPKVWQALLVRLGNAGGATPDVVSSFIRGLFDRFPGMRQSREAIMFLAYAQRWDPTLVFDLIKAWDSAEDAFVRQAQGELVGLVALVNEAPDWVALLDHLVQAGTEEAKIGLAHAGANLWSEAKFHDAAGALLIRLVEGAGQERIGAVVDIFRLADDLRPDPTTLALMTALANADADLRGIPSTFIVEKLQTLLPHGAADIGKIAQKLVDAWRLDLGDTRTATSSSAPELTDLALTLHRLGGPMREVGVSIFEALIDFDAYGARETLVEIDGRFGVAGTEARQRIARRRARRQRRPSAA